MEALVDALVTMTLDLPALARLLLKRDVSPQAGRLVESWLPHAHAGLQGTVVGTFSKDPLKDFFVCAVGAFSD